MAVGLASFDAATTAAGHLPIVGDDGVGGVHRLGQLSFPFIDVCEDAVDVAEQLERRLDVWDLTMSASSRSFRCWPHANTRSYFWGSG